MICYNSHVYRRSSPTIDNDHGYIQRSYLRLDSLPRDRYIILNSYYRMCAVGYVMWELKTYGNFKLPNQIESKKSLKKKKKKKMGEEEEENKREESPSHPIKSHPK